MSLSTWNKAIPAINLTLQSGSVAILVGHAGLGKTEVSKQIAISNGWGFVDINASNTKEGELNLPFLSKGADGSPRVFYGPHYALVEAKKLAENEYKNSYVLLLIDEINRCCQQTLTEFMQLIQQRRVAGFQLPENVKIMCCMNPSAEMEGYETSSYNITEMDAAIIDRGVFFYIKSDPEAWLDWAMQTDDNEVPNVDEKITSFIAMNPNMLHIISSGEFNNPTPRSWKKVSDIYRTMMSSGKKFNESHLRLACRGLIGQSCTQHFMVHIKANHNPLLEAKEIFMAECMTKPNPGLLPKHKAIIEKETIPRKTMIVKNCLNFVIKHKKSPFLPILISVIDLMANDIKVMIMRKISNEQPAIHNKLIEFDEYKNNYLEITKMINN